SSSSMLQLFPDRATKLETAHTESKQDCLQQVRPVRAYSFYAHELFDLMSFELRTSCASSPRAFLALQRPSWSGRRLRRGSRFAVLRCPRPCLRCAVVVIGMIQVRCRQFSCRYVLLTPLTVSVYSFGSAPTSSFNSPAVT